MRCFISIELPEELQEQVSEFCKTFDIFSGNFARKGNMHLTLKFLGEISEQKIQKVKQVLEQTKCSEFEISLKGLGGFPTENYVKVLWLGVDKGKGEIIKLQRGLDEKLSRIGFQKDKSFVPHLTLARVKFVRNKQALKQLFGQNRNKELGSFWCSRICLMKSELTPDGPVYCEL